MGLEVFDTIGTGIEYAWREYNYDEDVFPRIATDALESSSLLRTLTIADIAAWAVSDARLPAQVFRDFGQPPINVFLGHKFYIELLFWLNGTTAVHQHAFAGVVGVAVGSSFHSRYRFKQRERISDQLMLGCLELASCELLGRGDTRVITAGRGFIHSLFHLEQPTVSVVIRTYGLAHANPQYSYMPPGIAIDSLYRPEPFMTQLRLLATLAATDKELFWESARALARTADFWFALKLLSVAFRLSNEPAFEQLVGLLRCRHSNRIDDVLAALEEQRRQANIVARRRLIESAEHRYFLALLLNIPDRDTIYALVEARFPGCDPETRILDWIKELSDQGLIGLEFDVLSLTLLRFAMHGLSLDQVKDLLSRVYSSASVNEQSEKLGKLWGDITSALLLKPMFERARGA